ncbi:uncharacterized protein LOC127094257 [Lathyrus oleraceus]|uniref:uncharacterized protein LOC127094257 n=1 Tax=Pisum sativum TaxID=3888 RepID=UPI0021D2AAE2|nr:uncharacterized protein LOC127094257 [Pisum sativum]
MANTNERDSYNVKPPVFDGEMFDYWKDKIESFFLAYDADLLDIITIGYEPPISDVGIAIAINKITDDQKHYAGDRLEQKSTYGNCQFLGGNLISWASKRQLTISLSTAEAEYISVSLCTTQMLWMKNQLEDLQNMRVKFLSLVTTLVTYV